MFDSILSFFKTNRTGLSFIACAVALGCAAFVLNGCKVTDFVKVDVPPQVQKSTGSDAVVNLTEAPEVMDDYVMYGDRFAAEINDANERLGWIMSIADIGLRVGASQLPAGGLGLAALSLVGGLFLKGPGTSKEKEKSYAKGKAEAEATLIPLLTAAGITVPKEDAA